MTKPRYVGSSCAAGSQVHGQASSPAAWSPASYAWIVNFNNGNVNYNHRNNKAFVRAVRVAAPAGECQGVSQGKDAVSFRDMYKALQGARKNKLPSANRIRFESHWADNLIDIADRINAGTWSPSPATCFIARKPKAREMAAACGQFYDAVTTQALTHFDDAPLATALAGAQKRDLGDAWAWARRTVGVDISPLVAATEAAWGLGADVEDDVDPLDNIL